MNKWEKLNPFVLLSRLEQSLLQSILRAFSQDFIIFPFLFVTFIANVTSHS
uniref:Uncharacterized protein n=1 Tax=Moniliophthora roreri TaxID=221103 RepID=A0A0W0FHX3_MONRR